MKRYLSTALLLVVGVAAAACKGRSATDHVKKGDAFFQDRKWPEAAIEYRAALQQDPKLGDVRLKLGDVYFASNDLKNALAEYVRAADLLPNDVSAQIKAGQLLLVARRYEDARARADKAIEADPKNAQAQVLRGNALATLKDFDAAIAEFQDAIALDPSGEVAYTNLAVVQSAQGKRAEAEATFKKAIEAAPKSLTARMSLANFYWSGGQLAEAEQTLKAAYAIDPNDPGPNRALGLFYIGSNRVAEAEPYFVALAKNGKDERAAIGLADYYIIAKRPEEARKLLQDRVAHDTTGSPATVRLAGLEAAEGNRAGALDRLHTLLQREPKNTAAMLLSAQIYLQDDKRDQARSAAAAVIANDPNSAAAARAWRLTGQLDVLADRTGDAINSYQQALKLNPRPLAEQVALARLYLARLDAKNALAHAQQALAIKADDPDAVAVLVRADILAGDLAKAKTDLAPLEKGYPNTLGVLHLTGLMQLASKQPEAARATYARILKMNPNDIEALEGMQRLDLSGGHAKDAVARVDAQLKASKPTVPLLMIAARTHAAAGDAEGFESLLRQAIDVDPSRLQAYMMLGQFYARTRRIEEAKERFRDVLTRNPKSVSAATMIGMLLEQQGKTGDAEKAYEQTLAIDSRAAVASNNLAWIYVSANRKLDEALQLAQAAQQALPNEPNVNDTLGWIYYRKNMAPQALPFLETAAEKQPNEPVHHYHLGMAYMQMGDLNKARTALKKAFSLKSDFDGAVEARKALAIVGN